MTSPATRPRKLRNAPIVEALLDVKVTFSAPVHPDRLKEAHEALKETYPTIQQHKTFKAMFGLDPGEDSPESSPRLTGVSGYWFRSRDHKDTVQFRVDGFTYNRLSPYLGWDDIRPKALSAWNIYCAFAKPVAATRIAVRYINHIRGPRQGESFENYLQAPPTPPEGAPQLMNGFRSQMQLQQAEDSNLYVSLVQAAEACPEEERALLLVDIDAFDITTFDIPGFDVDTAWQRLRELKNKVFWGAITELVAGDYD